MVQLSGQQAAAASPGLGFSSTVRTPGPYNCLYSLQYGLLLQARSCPACLLAKGGPSGGLRPPATSVGDHRGCLGAGWGLSEQTADISRAAAEHS